MNKRNAGLNLTAAARFSSLTRRFQCPPCERLASRRSQQPSAFVRSVPALLPGAVNMHYLHAPGYQYGQPLAGLNGEAAGRVVICSALPAISMPRVVGDCRCAAVHQQRSLWGHAHDSWKMKLVRKKPGGKKRPPGYRMNASFWPERADTSTRQANNGITKRTIC